MTLEHQAQRDPDFAKLLAEAENAGKAKGRYVSHTSSSMAVCED